MKTVSLVIPVYNEEHALRANLRVILNSLPNDSLYQYEVLVVNDGSSDQTESIVATIAEAEPRMKCISFTRNFGKEAAITAGLRAAAGDAVIVMDSDLQHPPQLITSMLEYWSKGFLVVETVKSARGRESVFNKIGARAFYYIFSKLSGFSLADQSDFKLLDREVVKRYLELNEKLRFFRGLVHWLGYASVCIPFSVPERVGAGGSRWSSFKLVRYAIQNITTFSSTPLRLVSALGLLTLIFGLVFGSISLWQKFEGQALSGFTTVNLLIVVTGGSILFCMGIIGHYLALIYDEIKGRPHYVIKPKKNVENNR